MAEFHGETFDPPEHFNARRWQKLSRLGMRTVALEKRAAGASEDEAKDIERELGVLLMEITTTEDDLLEALVRPEDHERFEEVCEREGATVEELRAFTQAQIAELSGRPTGRSSDSASGPTSTPVSSAGDFSSREVAAAVHGEEMAGRADRAGWLLQQDQKRVLQAV